MTETERILKNNTVDVDFLKQENRLGYHVDEKAKKLWAINIDLLLKFDNVCNKNHLKWFMTHGTLLGAVRHSGFIPWDDDVDVYMLREDFDRLYELADEFEYPYFLQTPYTDNNCFFTTIRIRNSNTACIDAPFKYQGFNQGISLAVAPLDYAPLDGNAERIWRVVYELIMENAMFMRLSNPKLNKFEKARIRKFYKGSEPLKVYENIQDICRSQKKSTKLWSCASQHYGLKSSIFDLSDFEKSIDLQFERWKFPAPMGYDKVLQTIYGEYMNLPPEDERGRRHPNIDIYPDISYVNVMNEQVISSV